MSSSSEPVPVAFFVLCSRAFRAQHIKSKIENIRKDDLKYLENVWI